MTKPRISLVPVLPEGFLLDAWTGAEHWPLGRCVCDDGRELTHDVGLGNQFIMETHAPPVT